MTNEFYLEAWQTIQDGGVVMIALILLSVLLYRSALGTLFFVKGFSIAEIKSGIDENATNVELEIAYSQAKREFSEIVSRQVAYIGMLAAAAPLLGLLGTVIGMLETFESLSQRMQETTSQVSRGVRFALVTTQAGLIVAIPAIFMIQWIKREAKKRQEEIAHQELVSIHGERAFAK
ncbi:MotA/TolQ/ExbB proton channel family protein [Candidatus Pelagisphaera phototrophica]|uniref:MotA/TolQ/ExbB proton channel family protein n=1 Tax=Candidatus Pelagisphaera phototrophica TaxID=2684113 RepID=UPI0019FC4620|nr:MotA/TolQ/ExbB proton channel family protein [Candidatus Pelagisphaera phototrophica]QXD30790.1 MotA/TolQ/ExbB proton channel family protein [Candidatus Pelagisphaera phototrophica]